MKRKTTLAIATLAFALFGMVAVAGTALANGRGGPGGPGGGIGAFGGHGGHGLGMGAGDDDRGALLAQELGISVEDLRSAQLRALEKGLAAAVKADRLTQAQADLMLSGAKLRGAIDHDAVTAEALGISVEALKAARDAGKTMRDLLAEQKLDARTFRTQLTAAMDKAVAKAVADGVITQAQADALKAAKDQHGGMRGGMHGPRGGGGRGGNGGGLAPNDGGATTAPVSSDA